MPSSFLKADHKFFAAHILILSFFVTACSSRPLVDHPTTRATLWIQKAAEYKAICHQTYQVATAQLDKILDEISDSTIGSGNKKYAIITDVDETVLDNSPFQARMIMNNSDFNSSEWTKWVSEVKASSIPGAVEFMNYAASKGIVIYYITNREADTESYTRKNLDELGFPIHSETDIILTKYEKPEWTSSKLRRRAIVEEQYEVLMVFGDDLNDFYDAKKISGLQRNEIVIDNSDKWGNKWFMLPNPIYGSWEQSLFDFKSGISGSEKNEILLNSLDTKK